jgi:hypothetical protein
MEFCVRIQIQIIFLTLKTLDGLFAMIFNSSLRSTSLSTGLLAIGDCQIIVFPHFTVDKYGTAPYDERNMCTLLIYVSYVLRRVPWCRTSVSTERRAVPSWWR